MFVPLHVHSYHSLTDGLPSTYAIAKRCQELGYNSCGLSNHGNCFGSIEQQDDFRKFNIKPIVGNELYLSGQSAKIKSKENRKLSHLCVYAQNLNGWNNLVKIVSQSNHPDNFYYKPRLSLDELSQMNCTNLISFSGHPGSDLGNICFTSLDAYRCETLSEARQFINPNWETDLPNLANYYNEIFHGNFFLEIQLIDSENIPATILIAEMLRWTSRKTGISCVATADSHYTRQEDAHIQRILLCSSLKTTLKTVYNRLNNDEEFGLSGFFKSNNYHIPSLDDMLKNHTEDEIKTTELIADMCEDYKLGGSPRLPILYGNDDYVIKEKCQNRLNYLGLGQNYQERLNHELDVILKNKLSGYFLVMEDILDFTRRSGIMSGPGRGSAGGCLISYLLGITKVDPLPYNLLFERFYNDGRNTKDRIALPDIDVDFQRSKREQVIHYIKKKYGEDRVGHIMTLSSLQGRGALKEVFRVYDACSQAEQNEITKNIPQEAEISDHLEEMRKSKGYSSILEWTLENEPESVENWCKIGPNGLEGSHAKYFELAMKIEGVKKSVGKHASGIVLSDVPLTDIVPMVNQKGELICGMEMGSLEALGLPKLDILGLSTLDAISDATELINEELCLV